MSGSVSRSGSGWQYVIDAGLDANGRRRQHRRRGFATKELATISMTLDTYSHVLAGMLFEPSSSPTTAADTGPPLPR